MKNIFIFLFVIYGVSLKSQNFDYQREWGTYVGAEGAYFHSTNAFILDQQNNVYLNAAVDYQNVSNSLSYYNQFAISPGAYPFVANNQNFFLAEFSSSGNQLYGAYKGAANSVYESLLAIDHQNNKYILKKILGSVSNLASAGAWITTPPANAVNTYVLYKYDNAGNVIYSTYLPNTNQIRCLVQGDEVFIMGETNAEISNLSTPGVFQANYQNTASSGQIPSTNGYYVKLSGTGSKQVGTYLPLVSHFSKLFNGSLYFLVSTTHLPTFQSLITPGTFQQSGGTQIFVKFDANTATLVWGTMLGVNNPNAYMTGVQNFGVDSTGIYLYGHADDVVGGYYATPGAFRTQISGSNDFFLTKFDDNGNRVWGTYFGGNDYDEITGHGTVALYQDKIVVGGLTFGSDNIATPGSFLPSAVNASPMFFAGFDTNGNLEFCSYYGTAMMNNNGITPDEINASFDAVGNLYLWGVTHSTSGIATSNGAYPNAVSLQGIRPIGFLVKFSPKRQQMSVSEAGDLKDLILYDNPNNGNFTLSGNVLAKQNCSIKIFDLAGRVLVDSKTKKEKTQNFSMKGVLSKGTYMINVLNENQKTIKVFKMIVK